MAPQTPLRKRLTAIREAMRAPLRPGGQSEQVLRTLERMRNAQRVAEEEDEKAYRFRLSPVTAGIALAVMAATVGWSYFMGYMVGLGQNPARQVARLTGAPPPPPTPEVVAQAPLPPDIIKDDIPPEGAPDAAPPQPDTPAPKDAKAAAKDTRADTAKDAKAAAAKKNDGNRYPFARPSGQSLSAWGLDAPAQPAQDKKDSPASPAEKKNAAPAGQQLYDFVFQVAAFRKQDDADRLCRRLEEKGIRCRVQPSGKVMLVMAMLRGTALDGANLRAEFQRMGLGAPIQKSRKELKGRLRQ